MKMDVKKFKKKINQGVLINQLMKGIDNCSPDLLAKIMYAKIPNAIEDMKLRQGLWIAVMNAFSTRRKLTSDCKTCGTDDGEFKHECHGSELFNFALNRSRNYCANCGDSHGESCENKEVKMDQKILDKYPTLMELVLDQVKNGVRRSQKRKQNVLKEFKKQENSKSFKKIRHDYNR